MELPDVLLEASSDAEDEAGQDSAEHSADSAGSLSLHTSGHHGHQLHELGTGGAEAAGFA